MMPARRFIGALCVCALPFAAASADSVLLRDGTVIEGKVVGQNRQIVRIQTDTGSQVLPKTNIRRIVYGDVANKADAAEAIELQKKQQEALRKQMEEQRRLLEQQAGTPSDEAAEPTAPEPDEPDSAEPSPGSGFAITSHLTRSALLPGWGQFSQDRDAAGRAYAGGFSLALAATAGATLAYSAADSAYRSTADDLYVSVVLLGFGLPAIDPKLNSRKNLVFLEYLQLRRRDAAFRELGRNAAALNLAGGLLGLVYAANLFDVVYFAPESNLSLGLYAVPSGAGLEIRLFW